MIVKNEEDNIERALTWGRDIMCEQIVIDTGSTDRTVELAWALGAKVYYFEWNDDFAAAKNYAIEQASGDWIAFLDADEYVKAEDVGKLFSFIQQAEEQGYCGLQASLFNINYQEEVSSFIKQVRFFKSMPELRYKGMIHEQLELSDGRRFYERVLDASESVSIFHTGYIPAVMEKKQKTERNERILQKALELSPENYHIMGDLGDHYLSKDKQLAEYWYREAVRRIPRVSLAQHDRNVKTFLCLMEILYDRKDEFGLIQIYEDISSRFTGIYDADYILGKFYVTVQMDYQKGAYYLEHAFQLLEQYGNQNYSPMMIKEFLAAWEMLAACHYSNQKLAKCVSCCVGVLKMDKSRSAALELLLRAFAFEKPDSIVQFLGKLYDFKSAEDYHILCQACKNTGSSDVLQLLCNI
ncbi:MAG: glycosyltransferase family 2 protein [Lachnospiraceae bacterium]|nr:glycosyltransferase family 2 protein [Lachnospiraceae bacterium]